jgi:hypothetical protein
MRISDRTYQLLSLTLRVQRELEGGGHVRTPQPKWRKWRLLHLRQRLRATLRGRM